jgi:hypothetical protein
MVAVKSHQSLRRVLHLPQKILQQHIKINLTYNIKNLIKKAKKLILIWKLGVSQAIRALVQKMWIS